MGHLTVVSFDLCRFFSFFSWKLALALRHARKLIKFHNQSVYQKALFSPLFTLGLLLRKIFAICARQHARMGNVGRVSLFVPMLHNRVNSHFTPIDSRKTKNNCEMFYTTGMKPSYLPNSWVLLPAANRSFSRGLSVCWPVFSKADKRHTRCRFHKRAFHKNREITKEIKFP